LVKYFAPVLRAAPTLAEDGAVKHPGLQAGRYDLDR